MLDIKLIIKDPNKVKQAIINKGIKQISPKDIDRLIELYEKLKKLQLQIERLREQRNKNAQILKEELGEEEKQAFINEGRILKEKINELEQEYRKLKQEYINILQFVPNIPAKDVPIGTSEEDNIKVREWGNPKDFDFVPKTHAELLTNLGLLDLKRGVKVAGFRGYFLIGDLARLHFALLWHTFNKLVEKGYLPVIPPTLVHKWAMFGTGHFPWGEADAYMVEKSGLVENEKGKSVENSPYLVGTAEVPLIGMFKDEVIPEKKLPLKLVGFSPAYRKEVGAHAKDLKGLIRLHEFWKVEQIIIAPKDYTLAEEFLNEITRNQEELLQELDIQYRVMLMCTADMGEPHYKKYDIEAWLPGQNKYREVGSHSIMGDFQARRNNIRYIKQDGTKDYVITLNGTGVASPRILTMIVENYQTKDGRVRIPDVLRPYLSNKEYLEPVELY